MQGSLENPPVVISMSRRKVVWLLVLGVALTAMGVWLAANKPDDWRGYLCAGFFGLCIPVFVWQLLSPPRLEVSVRGIFWFTGRNTQTFLWKEFSGFRAYRPAPRTVSQHVGFEYAPDCPRRSKMTAVAHAMVGVDGSFGGNWEISAQDLADLLNQARQKWG
ncbi:MAG TPA: hypothetical protein VH189_01925 [Rhizomicrobium sp.]|nr:hypothetical protein [Rhizomicrobium sp.]